MPLGTDVGHHQGDIVLDGDPAPPHFSVYVYCGQSVGWIKMPLGMEIGHGPGHTVLDRDPAAPPPERGTAPPLFSPCLLWSSGWMDQDATRYGGRRALAQTTLCQIGTQSPPSIGQVRVRKFSGAGTWPTHQEPAGDRVGQEIVKDQRRMKTNDVRLGRQLRRRLGQNVFHCCLHLQISTADSANITTPCLKKTSHLWLHHHHQSKYLEWPK